MESNSEFIVCREALLLKFPGKGGWTFADIPEINPNPNKTFGWVSVSGFIDDYKVDYLKLMAKKDGLMFLPVKAKIRKEINKHAGDIVFLKLNIIADDFKVPEDIKTCLLNHSNSTLVKFKTLPDDTQRAHVDHINEAQMDDTRVKRINDLIDRLNKMSR